MLSVAEVLRAARVFVVEPVLRDHQIQTRNTKKAMLYRHLMEYERNSMVNSGVDCVQKRGVQKSPNVEGIALGICHQRCHEMPPRSQDS